MRLLLIHLLLVGLALAGPSPLLERASKALEEETLRRFHSGSQSRTYKKGNPLSRSMGHRNALYRKAMDLLTEEDRMEEEEARAMVMEELNRGDGHHGSRPGGFGGKSVPPINLPGDLCDEGGPNVDCGTEAEEKYRRIDGRCNNLNDGRELWGSAGVAFLRMANPRYQDGVDSPTLTCKAPSAGNRRRRKDGHHGGGGDGPENTSGSNQDECCPNDSGAELPNARFISATVHLDSDVPSPLTHMVTQMGQFLDHDITLTPEVEVDHCCDNPSQHECLPINVDPADPFYSMHSVDCLEFSRSEPFCENGDLRRQFNAITAFVDASNVYGSDVATADSLRTKVDGLMRTTSDNLLPLANDLSNDPEARAAGDVRSNEMPGLAAMHTLWVREHNRIAAEIKASGTVQATDADAIDEEIYQRTRVVVIAEMQKVVYDEYLPKILGAQQAEQMGITLPPLPPPGHPIRRTRYRPDLNPGIFNGFATAAYRFGHSMIQGLIQMWTVGVSNPTETDSFVLSDNFFNMAKYKEAMEQILAGLISQPAQVNDEFLTSEVTEQLFKDSGAGFGTDLAARNIQRGRDHGLAGYGAYRKACGLPTPGDLCSWADQDRPSEIPLDRWRELRDAYSPTLPRDMDLFTAGLAESPVASVNNPEVGPTFSCMIASQFRNIKDGDRLFFTHGCTDSGGSRNRRGGRGGGGHDGGHDGGDGGGGDDHCSGDEVMTSDQVRTVMGRSLRDILCDNTGITHAQPDVFVVPGTGNEVVPCAQGYSALDSSLF